jgi:hypothetical protein
MRHCSALFILACSFAVAQTSAPAPAAQANAPAPSTASGPSQNATANSAQSAQPNPPKETKAVLPDAAVITIEGVCANKPTTAHSAGKSAAPVAKSASGECKTVITRKQFDVLADALYGSRVPNGEIPASAKRNLAQNWAKVIALSAQAEKDGLIDQPRTQALIKFGKEQAAAQEEAREIEKKATPTDAEIQKYYDDNKSTKYWEAEIERIIIPAHGTGEHAPDEAAIKKLTDDIVTRAKAGQPFDQLQKEVSDKLGISSQIQTKTTVRPEMLPPAVEKQLREAKPGEVETTSNPGAGTQVYKVIKFEDVPLDKVKETIKRQLLQERGQQQFDAVLKAHPATFNDEYLGPEVQPQGAPGASPSR